MKVCVVGASGKLGRYMVAARARARLRGGRRLPRAERRQARRVRRPDHRGPGRDRRPGGDRAGGRRVRRGARRARPLRGPWLLDRYRPGRARPCRARRAPRLLLRLAHHQATARTSTRGSSRWFMEVFGKAGTSRPGSPTSTTRSRPPGGCSPATPGGPSCAAATSKRARARACPSGAEHVGDPILESNRTRRVDFALFMVEALDRRRARPRGAGDRRPPDAPRRSPTPAPEPASTIPPRRAKRVRE